MSTKLQNPDRDGQHPAKIGNKGIDSTTDVAELQLCPNIQGARTAARILGENTGPALTLRLAEELSTQVNAVLDGDLSRAESMLVTQAHTLDALFNSLLRAAMSIEGTPYFEQYLRVALKAQSQARTTLEALGRIKNPTVAFVKQANVAQQVNNYASSDDPTGGHRESEYPPSKVLEEDDGEPLDT